MKTTSSAGGEYTTYSLRYVFPLYTSFASAVSKHIKHPFKEQMVGSTAGRLCATPPLESGSWWMVESTGGSGHILDLLTKQVIKRNGRPRFSGIYNSKTRTNETGIFQSSLFVVHIHRTTVYNVGVMLTTWWEGDCVGVTDELYIYGVVLLVKIPLGRPAIESFTLLGPVLLLYWGNFMYRVAISCIPSTICRSWWMPVICPLCILSPPPRNVTVAKKPKADSTWICGGAGLDHFVWIQTISRLLEDSSLSP